MRNREVRPARWSADRSCSLHGFSLELRLRNVRIEFRRGGYRVRAVPPERSRHASWIDVLRSYVSVVRRASVRKLRQCLSTKRWYRDRNVQLVNDADQCCDAEPCADGGRSRAGRFRRRLEMLERQHWQQTPHEKSLRRLLGLQSPRRRWDLLFANLESRSRIKSLLLPGPRRRRCRNVPDDRHRLWWCYVV